MFLYPLLAPANLGVFDVVVTRLNWSRRVVWLEMVSAAASIIRPSPTESAIGFSTKTCLPACNAEMACSAWSELGVAMYTTSTAASFSSMS